MSILLTEESSASRLPGGDDTVPFRSVHQSPYHPLLVSARIQRALTKYGKTRTDLAKAMGVTLPAVSQKFSQNENRWSLDDIAVIHHYISGLAGRPLLGFPLLDEALVEKLDAWYLGESDAPAGRGKSSH